MIRHFFLSLSFVLLPIFLPESVNRYDAYIKSVNFYVLFADQNPKYWQEILDTNVMGLAICTQEALKLMKEAGVNDGHIIHINRLVFTRMKQENLRGRFD